MSRLQLLQTNYKRNLIFHIMFSQLLVTFCFEFRLKMKNTHLYLGGDTKNMPLLVPFDRADIFAIEKENGKQMSYIVVKTKENRIFDIEANEIKLIYWSTRKNARNQLFIIALDVNGSNKLYVMGNCVGYSVEDKYFKRMECNDDDENQIFEVEPVGSISEKENLLDSIHENDLSSPSFGLSGFSKRIIKRITNRQFY